MIKKLITLTILSSMTLFAEVELNSIPMEKQFVSTDNGGNIYASDAYKDGIGLFFSSKGKGGDINNSAMNKMVFKYGEEAKESGETLTSYVSDNGDVAEQTEAADIKIANGAEEVLYNIGSSCNDGDAATENDVYIDTDGTCQGEAVALDVSWSITVYANSGTSLNNIVDGYSASAGQPYIRMAGSTLLTINTTKQLMLTGKINHPQTPNLIIRLNGTEISPISKNGNLFTINPGQNIITFEGTYSNYIPNFENLTLVEL